MSNEWLYNCCPLKPDELWRHEFWLWKHNRTYFDSKLACGLMQLIRIWRNGYYVRAFSFSNISGGLFQMKKCAPSKYYTCKWGDFAFKWVQLLTRYIYNSWSCIYSMLYIHVSQRMAHINDWELSEVKNKTKTYYMKNFTV